MNKKFKPGDLIRDPRHAKPNMDSYIRQTIGLVIRSGSDYLTVYAFSPGREVEFFDTWDIRLAEHIEP